MLKQILVGNFLGRILISIRDKYKLLRAAYFWPQFVGSIANDQLASDLVVSLCKPNATFIDVGAHIGSIVAGVNYLLPDVKIIAIEAIPEKVDSLKKQFPFVEIHHCAVGEIDGAATFYVNTTRSGYSSLMSPNRNNKDVIHEIKVPVKKFDDIVTVKDVDVIKIDVEGAELGVLRGAKKFIETNRPIIMFESGPVAPSLMHIKKELYTFLDNLNYAIIAPNRLAFYSVGLTLEAFIDSHIYPFLTTNIFAVPIERSEEVLQLAFQKIKPKEYT